MEVIQEGGKLLWSKLAGPTQSRDSVWENCLVGSLFDGWLLQPSWCTAIDSRSPPIGEGGFRLPLWALRHPLSGCCCFPALPMDCSQSLHHVASAESATPSGHCVRNPATHLGKRTNFFHFRDYTSRLVPPSVRDCLKILNTADTIPEFLYPYFEIYKHVLLQKALKCLINHLFQLTKGLI